ncbi:MAG: GTPase HflX [Lachnospiraceae bacterium]
MIETQEYMERVLLVGVQTHAGDDTEQSMDELEALAHTAGAVTVGKMIQNRENIHPGYYVGSGKLEEIRQMVYATDATGIICDDELSASQINNLARELDTKIMDRTLIILSIFAKRATTSEGKIQVELAQLRYRAVRLTGLRDSLSRLGGGIGTRGPGEKKLEMDRRLIKERITGLKRELAAVREHRDRIRAKRQKQGIPVAAIVGYTNAGKSTLLNHLTHAGVLEEDKLFATLDPTTRLLELEDGQAVLLTDTVGFIRKLPHNLIEAFKSTLEEAKYADFIIHVVDASSEQMEAQMHIVYETLRSLEALGKPIITVFNKIDKQNLQMQLRDIKADHTVRISARTGAGVDELKQALREVLGMGKIEIARLFSYEEAGLIQLIRSQGQLISEEYTEQGIFVKALVPKEIYHKVT